MTHLAHSPFYEPMVQLVKQEQRKLVARFAAIDGLDFLIDEWTRPNGGFGISCVLEDGNVFERAGINISVVHGTLTGAAVQQMRANHSSIASADQLAYSAVGLSLILHPIDPFAPTVHMNCRFLETFTSTGELDTCWFGGGTDLTPAYLFEDDARHFHSTLKTICDEHDASYYPRFKKWCDEYFWNAHRNEARGIGGIFFDDLDAEEGDAFARHFLSSFLRIYEPIILRRKDVPFGESHKVWQQLRRGRYVEFNLLHDRGTKFGLAGDGPRVESILVSMPRNAS